MAGDRMQGRRCASPRLCEQNDQYEGDGSGKAAPWLLTGRDPGSNHHSCDDGFAAFLVPTAPLGHRSDVLRPQGAKSLRQLGLSDAYPIVWRGRNAAKEGS
jgi:hypothetical protein